MASFTGVGDSVSLTVPEKGEDILVSISGTYSMVIELQLKVKLRLYLLVLQIGLKLPQKMVDYLILMVTQPYSLG